MEFSEPPPILFHRTIIIAVHSMNSNLPQPKYSGSCLPKKDPLSRFRWMLMVAERFHPAADETWLIAVAVPAKRPARHGSHVALRLLSDRFIFCFLHLHPSSSFTFSRRPSPVAVSPPVLLLSFLLPSLVPPVPSSHRSPPFSLSFSHCDSSYLTAPISASKCDPRMRNSHSDT